MAIYNYSYVILGSSYTSPIFHSLENLEHHCMDHHSIELCVANHETHLFPKDNCSGISAGKVSNNLSFEILITKRLNSDYSKKDSKKMDVINPQILRNICCEYANCDNTTMTEVSYTIGNNEVVIIINPMNEYFDLFIRIYNHKGGLITSEEFHGLPLLDITCEENDSLNMRLFRLAIEHCLKDYYTKDTIVCKDFYLDDGAN